MTRLLFSLAAVLFGSLALAQSSTAVTAALPEEAAVRIDGSRIRSLEAQSCSPTETIIVDRFEVDVAAMADQIEITILVDGEILGTESIHFAELSPAPVRLEILRFNPDERQRLIHLMDSGAVVELRSPLFSQASVPLETVRDRVPSPDRPRAEIARSIWREGGNRPSDSSLRRLFQAQTFYECRNDCADAHGDCEASCATDPQCLGWCENEYNWCVDNCPCDGFDPILVDEYTETEVHVVSGPHRTVCAGNIFSSSNSAYYDEYVVFFRVKTYRVWEDCHGDQTTELVSTSDSSNRWCYKYSGQICSSSPGTQPPCVF